MRTWKRLWRRWLWHRGHWRDPGQCWSGMPVYVPGKGWLDSWQFWRRGRRRVLVVERHARTPASLWARSAN